MKTVVVLTPRSLLGCILNTVPAWRKAYKLRVAVFVEYEVDVEEERSRVKTLLENLRIEADILVFCLASGGFKTYQIIINGRSPDQTAERLVDEVLKDEDWWQDVQNLRGAGAMSASEELADAQGLLKAGPSWPSSSFQQGRGKTPLKRFESLRRLIRNSKRRRSSTDLNGLSGLNGLGARQSMQTHRLDDEMLHRHASHASASEESESDGTDSEALESESALEDEGISPASEPGSLPQMPPTSRPRPIRQPSAANFSSRPQPRTKVNSQDGPGPSIMFTDAPLTPPKGSPSIYNHGPSPASGFPSQQSTPLSFNDLPCRAQHLILNELMQQNSKDTAVLFTTLPSPVEGTSENEEDCVSYLSDLEVLWQGLPPVLLVHSNSMTVTMNL